MLQFNRVLASSRVIEHVFTVKLSQRSRTQNVNGSIYFGKGCTTIVEIVLSLASLDFGT